jgi:murein tripeptide amidase MpaA
MKANFDAYVRYDQLTRALHALAEEHPGFCKVESIGKSYEGREIWLAELTNAETGPAETKPAFWVDGNTHAGEVTGSMAALYLVEHLLEKHGSEDLPTRLLDEQAFYVLPRRGRALLDDGLHLAGAPQTLARARRRARPPPRGCRR